MDCQLGGIVDVDGAYLGKIFMPDWEFVVGELIDLMLRRYSMFQLTVWALYTMAER